MIHFSLTQHTHTHHTEATAAAAAARRREGPSTAAASNSPLGQGGGMGAMAALPQEVLVQSVAGFLGLRELTRVHMTCKVCDLKEPESGPFLLISWVTANRSTTTTTKQTQIHHNTQQKQTFTLWLDDSRAWAHIPWLDLSYQSLAVRRSRSGRTCVQPMDLTMLEGRPARPCAWAATGPSTRRRRRRRHHRHRRPPRLARRS